MCYQSPGPRCAGHTRTELAKATRVTAAALQSGDATAYEKARDAEMVARTAWLKSPEGIKHLREQGEHELAFSYENERASKIKMVKQVDRILDSLPAHLLGDGDASSQQVRRWVADQLENGTFTIPDREDAPET